MKRTLAFAAALVLSLCGGSIAAAKDAELPVHDIDVSDDHAVSLTATAPGDLAGQHIPAEAFTVEEAGVEITPTVTRVRNDTLQVVLVMDTSGSMLGQPMTAAKAAARNFIRRMPAAAQLSIVSFSSDVDVLTNFSSSRGAHLQAIASLQPNGETALYDGKSVV